MEAAEARDPESVEAATLRLIRCAVGDRDATARAKGDCGGCPEKAVWDLLRTMAAQREASAQRYDDTGRVELAEREREELEVIQRFFPKTLEEEALQQAVERVVDDLDASKLKDVGRCMDALKSRYPGQIDPTKAGRVVRRALV